MAFRRLTDREAARVGVVTASALQVAAALGWAGVSNVNAAEAAQVLTFTIPLTLAAGEWIRRKVHSRVSAEALKSVAGREVA